MAVERLDEDQVGGMLAATQQAIRESLRWLRIIEERNPERQKQFAVANNCLRRAEEQVSLLAATHVIEMRKRAGERDTASDNG